MTDVNLRAAVDACGNLAKSYRGVLALTEAVGKLGDLDAHRAELEQRRDTAQAELDGVLASLTTAKQVAGLEQAKAAAERALAALKTGAERERAALSTILSEQSAARSKVQSFKSEAAEVEKRLTTMRADVANLQARFAQ